MDDLVQRVNANRAPEDGIGWLLDYVCRLLKTYHSFTLEFVWDELAMDEGWCYWNFAYQDDPMHKFSGVKAAKNYMRQEVDKLVEEAKRAWQES